MQLTIKPLRKEDYGQAIQFAIDGMHFDHYFDSPLAMQAYGRYFWYDELSQASQVIAAYYGDELAGVLLANMQDEPKAARFWGHRLYVNIVDGLQRLIYHNAVDKYDQANQKMYRQFTYKHLVAGEINFLAANPRLKIKGIGTLLLQELERRENGKPIYLYTDDNCTYQFYEHRGFTRVGQQKIGLDLTEKGNEPLECYMYYKICGR